MESGLVKICSVALGGAIGSVARYLVNISPLQNSFVPIENSTGRFPVPTFLVNLIGSFLIGFFLIVFGSKVNSSESLRLAVMVGFLGAFTTFSTFELEIWELVNKGRYLIALAYLTFSVFFGFVGLILGMWLAKKCC